MALVGIWYDSTDNFATLVGDVTPNTVFGVPAAAKPALNIGNGAGAAYARFSTPDPADQVTTAFYIKTPDVWPGQSFNINGLRADTTSVALAVALGGTGAPGQIRLVSPGGVIVASSPNGTLEVNTEYRFVVSYNTATLAGGLRVYAVNGSPDPIWSTSAVSPNWNAAINYVDFGRLNASPTVNNFLMDRLEVHDDVFIDPVRDPADVPVVAPPNAYPLYWYGPGTDDPDLVVGNVTNITPGGYPSNAALVFEQAAGATAYTQWNLPQAEPTLTVRLFFKTPAVWPSASYGLIACRPTLAGNGPSATISGAGQPGQIRLTSGATTMLSSPNNTLTVGTWYRVELQYKNSTSEARVGLFALGLNTPIWTSGWITHAAFATACAFVQIGRNTSSPTVGPFRVSDIFISDQVGSWAGGGDTQGLSWGVWNGTTVRPASVVQVWSNGTLKSIV